MTALDQKLTTAAGYVLAAVVVLVPFHALLTIGLSQLIGHYGLLKIWKEVVLLALTPVVAYLAWRTPGLWTKVKAGWLVWCILAYVVLNLTLGLVALAKHQVNAYALLFAWVINLRFLLVFVLAYVVAARSAWLRGHWEQLLLWPALAVVGFAMLQLFLLPTNFLGHFGYDATTIAPYETVDQKLAYVRIQSTLRGANPLGAYLVLIVAALVALLLKSKRDNRQLTGITLLSASLLALVATYSRSAYVGAVLAALVAIALVVHGRKAKLRLAYTVAAMLVLAVVALLALRTNDRFENTFFHTDEHSLSQTSSNQGHLTAYQSALHDVLREPFGRGPGTAGPASVHNMAPARIAENYFLQIGQETGWLGLALFIAINALLVKRLWQRREVVFARFLLASLIGISFVNLTLHAWTDDTLAILWWTLAGIAVAPALYKETKKQTERIDHGQKKFKKVSA